jgi:hypothetical protein
VGTSEGSTDLFSMSPGQRDMQESFLRGWSEILESYFVIHSVSAGVIVSIELNLHFV